MVPFLQVWATPNGFHVGVLGLDFSSQCICHRARVGKWGLGYSIFLRLCAHEEEITAMFLISHLCKIMRRGLDTRDLNAKSATI